MGVGVAARTRSTGSPPLGWVPAEPPLAVVGFVLSVEGKVRATARVEHIGCRKEFLSGYC